MKKKRLSKGRSKWRSQALKTILCVLATVGGALACGWNLTTEHSVRFNPYRTAREFGRLPHLSQTPRAKHDRLFKWDEKFDYDYTEWESDEKVIDRLWEDIIRWEQRDEIASTKKKLRRYLELTAYYRRNGYGGPQEVQKRRNSAFDKLDAIASLDKGASASAVRQYLAARSLHDNEQVVDAYLTKEQRKRLPQQKPKSAQDVIDALKEARADKQIEDNAAYLEAALRTRGDEEAIAGFEKLAARHPNSEKREAALYMAALLTMKQSKCFLEKSNNPTPDPSIGCRDDNWIKARAGFERVMREYPGGRYYTDARGWIAHLWLCGGDRAEALAEYYRMLADKDEAGRIEAIVSLKLTRQYADEAELARLEKLLEREPSAALAYAYHSIYNYAPPYPYNSAYYARRMAEERELQKNELERIARFATRMIKRHAGAGARGPFILRVAEVNLELGNDSEAASLAEQALSAKVTGEHRAEALWVKGVALHRLRQYEKARDALTMLVAENPNNRCTEGARRNLAMVAEDMGDLYGALDQYLALDYRYDVAYFIDVLMLPGQLAVFIRERPQIAQRDELLYALGLRYMRLGRWTEARQTLSSVKTVGRGVDLSYRYRYNGSSDYGEELSVNAKDAQFDPEIKGVRPQWVEMDLKTAEDLERLERAVEVAEGDEAKAEALYQLASYQFERSLLFYNPAWRGVRHYLLYDLYNEGWFRQPHESHLLFDYMQNHDMAARALTVYLEVARRFPDTRAARDALYSAAVCHDRLADYNNYWRDIYQEKGHAGARFVSYKDVKVAYPDYRYPLGTIGWEPSTRTVKGGPGWAELPKPPRPQPLWKRITRRVNLIVSQALAKIWQAILFICRLILLTVHWLALIIGLLAWCCAMAMKRKLMREARRYGRCPRALLEAEAGAHRMSLPLNDGKQSFSIKLWKGWLEVSAREMLSLARQFPQRRRSFIMLLHVLTYAPAALFLLILLKAL